LKQNRYIKNSHILIISVYSETKIKLMQLNVEKHKFTQIVIINFFANRQPLQLFLGCHLGFPLFFTIALWDLHTFFYSRAVFGLDIQLYENVIDSNIVILFHNFHYHPAIAHIRTRCQIHLNYYVTIKILLPCISHFLAATLDFTSFFTRGFLGLHTFCSWAV